MARLSRPLTEAALLMALAASSLAVSGFFAKLAMASVTLHLAVTTRFVLPWMLTAAWLWSSGQGSQVRRQDMISCVPRALALCLAQFCLYGAIERCGLGLATILYNTGPIFITLHSALLHRAFSHRRLSAVGLGFLGVVLLSSGKASGSGMEYLWLGVLAGLFQAASQILLHQATRTLGTTLVMLHVYAIGSLFWLLILALARPELVHHPIHSGQSWGLVGLWLLGAALGSMGNQQWRGEAYRRVDDPAVLSPLIYLSIAVSLLLDKLVFNTQLQPLQWLGAAVIVTGALLANPARGRP